MTSRPKVILGAGMFGGPRTPDAASVKAQLDLFKSHGHDTIDTSRVYPVEQPGRSEEILAETRASETFVIDTKINSLGERALSSERVAESIDQSLKALHVDCVDILYLTLPSIDVPLEETAEAMDKAFKQGKFKRFGLSNYSPEEVEQFVEIAERRDFVKPSVYQGQYNPIARLGEKDLFAVLRKHNVAFYAYTPSGAGIFSGKVNKDSIHLSEGRFSHSYFAGKFYSAAYLRDELLESAMKVHNAAQKLGISGHAVALRWVLHHSALKQELGDGMIIGAAKIDQLEENLKICDDGPLPAELVKVVEDIWPVAEPVAPWAWIDAKAQAEALKQGMEETASK